MFKLLFSTAMIAPVLLFAASGLLADDDAMVRATPRTAVLAAGTLPGTLTDLSGCRSETLPLVFHDGFLEMHSAESLRSAFASDPACEIERVRLTTLVPENANEVEVAGANARRAEVAATIAAIVGEDRAARLEMRADLQSTASNTRLRHHALLRVERRPAATADSVAVESVAEAGAGDTDRSLN